MSGSSALPDIGSYRHVARIAIGGMAEVFRALKKQSAGADRAVVIKRLLPQLAEDPEGCAMFEHEARLGMRIRHPNVVEVLDHSLDGELPYLVLEYVFGVDLRRLSRYLARTGRAMRPALAAFVGTEMLAGLEAVHGATDEDGHALHVVHRDVSPSNVFLSVHGHVKLGDLGIALPERREVSRTPPPVRATMAKGKLGYLAPELVAGVEIDARADLFSAAVIVAEMLLGRPLFTGASQLAVLLAIRDADVAPLRAIASRLPDGMADALLPALARDASDRTPTATELRLALLPYVDAPDETLRAELGKLVVAALDAGEVEEVGVDRASLARTAEHPSHAPTSSVPAPPPAIDVLERALMPEGDRASLFDLDSPGAAFGPHYEVRGEGAVLGPWPYSRMVQALRTGEITGAREARARGERAWQPIAGIPALARHLPPSARMPGSHPSLAATSESHDLSARGGIVPVLLDVLRDRATGLLLCERPGVRKEVHVARGVPTFVSSTKLEELLGETLVAEGVIDRTELHLALAVMPRFEGRLGDTLVALGLVDPLRLVRHIAGHAREKLLELLVWNEGRATMHLGEVPSSGVHLHLDGWGILAEGMKRRIELGLERSLAAGTLVAQRDEIEPPADWAAVIGRCARGCRLAELEIGSPDPARARAIAYLLVYAGALRFEPDRE